MLHQELGSIARQSRPLQAELYPAAVEISAILGFARRQWLLLAGGTAALLAAASLYLSVTPAQYTATATLMMEPKRVAPITADTVSAVPDTAMIDSRVQVILSDRIARAVLSDERVASAPEIAGEDQPGWLESAATVIFGEVVTPEEDEPSLALERFKENLSVSRVNQTYLIQISFRSTNRESAAAVANATAEAFVRDLRESEDQASSGISGWLEPRILELRERVETAERAVQRFKSQHDLVSFGASSPLEEQLADLIGQLVLARARASQEQAKLGRITELLDGDLSAAVFSDVLESPIISRLRQQQLEAKRRLEELVANLGVTGSRDHPLVAQHQREIGHIERSIHEELERLQASIRSEYGIAQDYENSLQSSIDEIKAMVHQADRNQVTLSDLESAARSYRNLYERMLEHSLTVGQKQALAVAEANVISEASPPLRKSHPRSLIILAAAGLLGLAFGAIGGATREKFDRTIRSQDALEAATGARPLAAVPVVAHSRKRRKGETLRTLPAKAGLPLLDSGKASSASNTAIARVKLAIDFAHASRRTSVLGVVSAVPGEGATTIATNLADLMASAGRKVLLIDGNQYNPMLSVRLFPGSNVGLHDVLNGKVALDEAVWRNSVNGVAVLPASVAEPVRAPSELLSSEAGVKFLASAREEYDYVIVDLPALSPSIDARAVSQLVDAFILVVEAGKTAQGTVLEALRSSPEVREKLLGAVLNKARKEKKR